MSTGASNATIGAVAGLAFGLAEYVLVLRMIGRALAWEAKQEGEMPGLASIERRMRTVRFALMGFAFLVMPALGYAVGRMLEQ